MVELLSDSEEEAEAPAPGPAPGDDDVVLVISSDDEEVPRDVSNNLNDLPAISAFPPHGESSIE